MLDQPAVGPRPMQMHAPLREPQRLALVRSAAQRGSITAVWSWRGGVRTVEFSIDTVRVLRQDGREDLHTQSRDGWRIESSSGAERVIELGAGAAAGADRAADTPRRVETLESPAVGPIPARYVLGAEHYRRSEESWEEAGRPTATVSLERSRDLLIVHVDVPRAECRFVDVDAANPLDNDPAAIHGDGVQLYVAAGTSAAGWLLVPVPASTTVGRRVAEGWSAALTLDARWRPSADGYALTVQVTLPSGVSEVSVDVIVNETAPGRTRRRGQLVLSGARSEFVYLRSDRHDRDRLLRFGLRRG